jgi:hypothetical protein
VRRPTSRRLGKQGRKVIIPGGIHDLIPAEKILGWSYNTRELLLAHERISKHVEWARKQK